MKMKRMLIKWWKKKEKQVSERSEKIRFHTLKYPTMKNCKIKIISTVISVIAGTFIINARLPGPDYIYECPKCSALLKKGSNASENFIGSTLYSDGKRIAPMAPQFPNLTKCDQCDTILWLSEMNEIGICDFGIVESKPFPGEVEKEKCKPEWEKAERAKFLDVADLFRFLELDTVLNDKVNEKYVRYSIWHAFNDRVRAGGEIFDDENNVVLWERNCRQLIELLDPTNDNQKITTAELHRNLGEFEVCMKLINSLGSEYDWLISKFRIECDKRNKSLIILRSEEI